MCSLERQRIGNSLFTNRIFVSVIGIAFTIALPALFLAVVIPAYDRVLFFAVIQNPAVTDRCKGERRIVGNLIFIKAVTINIVTCNICMVIVDFSLAANLSSAAAIVQATAVAIAMVECHRAILHIQNTFWKDFNAICITGSSELCTFLNLYIAIPVTSTGIDKQTRLTIVIQHNG